MKVKRLTYHYDRGFYATLKNERFWSNLKPGDVFTYSDAYSMEEVIMAGVSFGVIVKYCMPGTPEYAKHGCYTCKAVGYDLDSPVGTAKALKLIDDTLDCLGMLKAVLEGGDE